MLKKTGVPTAEDILKVVPSPERVLQGPVAVIECFQAIPCNPCFNACKRGAIQEFQNINDLPVLDQSKCNGCGICAATCPGLAIFVIDGSYSENEAIVKIPYEFLPMPETGAEVIALDRTGQAVGKARVIKVQRIKGQERTPLIWLAVRKDLVMSVRNFKMEGQVDA